MTTSVLLSAKQGLPRFSVTLNPKFRKTLRHQICELNITVIFLVPLPEYDLEPCEDPGRPQFGGHAGSRFGIGDSLAFTCNAGYRLQGAREVVCLGGGRRMWSAPLPRCVGTWSALSTPVSFLLLFQFFCCCCCCGGCSYQRRSNLSQRGPVTEHTLAGALCFIYYFRSRSDSQPFISIMVIKMS